MSAATPGCSPPPDASYDVFFLFAPAAASSAYLLAEVATPLSKAD
jgi:hypothetical protein